MPEITPRTRWKVALWIPVVVAAGLATRSDFALSHWVATYGGDTFYAVLVYVLLAFVFARSRPLRLAGFTTAICGMIEVSQMWHPAWLDSIRATRLGALVLGHGFIWTDLACYTVGALLAFVVDSLFARRT